MATIAEKIKNLRVQTGLTQEDFAHKIGISRSNLAQIETGKTNPTFEAIGAICSAFNIDANYLHNESLNVNENAISNVIQNVGNNVILNSENADFDGQKTTNTHASGISEKIDYFANSKKLTAFYKKVFEQAPELDNFMSDLTELEHLKDDLNEYIEKLNKPINEVYDSVIAGDYKSILSNEFVSKNVLKLSELKKYAKSVRELVDLINSVLLFEESE
ncbi:helix-turn-helix domain-containing protein [Mucilaginibacter gossypii]|uniref:helix-turn-helix domain-containing protein n=1 Tax=Mucilaginibacter gossypii TaxID=551996 RepID=UPI000DCC34DD|nr:MULTISPECIES: helix-turn-helix transcriptional regulator [Mucilaginibacter]QTE39504.1 helix-turn-helix domain-containing protein [Mucilaginibacter gossypii]RAV56135.1 hypothetical protein DIU36_15380 [Mucilaginibacter rubeus]